MNNTRCLYESELDTFINEDCESVFGILCERYHGDALTTTREAWLQEIKVLQKVLRGKDLEGILYLNMIFLVWGKE